MTQAPAAPIVRRTRGISPVWIVPLVALAVAAALVLRDWFSHGPTYEVIVPSADGLEPDRTPVKCAGVVVGRVTAVTLLADGLRPVAEVELEPWARRLLHEDARFWIERPEISLQGIRGLGTLTSGPFLALEPGKGGSPPRRFTALGRAPIADAPGLLLQLTAPRLRALRRGSPVLYRDFPVGQVIDLALGSDSRGAIVTIRIEPRYAPLVRSTSRFWNASGFSLDLGITGLSTQVESLESVLVGGVSFATPDPP
ncbi:MAG: MCE family protein, partial [Phycisphaerae bacterium]|nr:MCE family protein [Phycisphaerae bacterium]